MAHASATDANSLTDRDAAEALSLTLAQTQRSAVMALGAGAVALISPPAALLVLALLAARALMRAERAPRIEISTLIAPVLAAIFVGSWIGLAAGVGVLFVWRLGADARWSVREALRLAQIAGRPAQTRRNAQIVMWLTPLYCLSIVAFTAPHMVAGLPLDLPHVPLIVPVVMGGIAALGVFDWALRRAADWRLGELAQAPAAHLLAHHLLFLVAYGVTLDVSAGLVAMAAWRLVHAAPGQVLTMTSRSQA